MRNPSESQDDYDNEGPIWDEVKLTPYDKRRAELRDLEAKREAILSKSEQTAEDVSRLAVLAPLIDKAQARFDREGKRALDDTYRKRRGIDEWRAGEGREEYNAKRRDRPEPNADLTALTPEQKKRRKQDQTNDGKFIKRCRADGWPEARIQAELVVRIREREAERAAEAQVDADETKMKSGPTYGMF